MNSTFHVHWLASSEVSLQAANKKQNGFRRYIVTNKVALWAASYSACVVYTKTINLFTSVLVKVADTFTLPRRLGKYPPLFTSTPVNNNC